MASMKFALLLAFLSVAHCQTTTGLCQWNDAKPPVCVPVTQPGATVTLKPAPLPNLFLVGGEYGTSTSPHFSGFVALALPVSTTAGLYSYSMYQGLIQNGKLVTSTTTGLADDLKTISFKQGALVLVGLGTAGVSTGAATTGAFAGGGGLLFRWNDGWVTGVMGIQNAAAGSSKPNLLVAFGRTW